LGRGLRADGPYPLPKSHPQSPLSKRRVEIGPPFYVVRPAGRTHLEVKVLYRPDRGNC